MSTPTISELEVVAQQASRQLLAYSGKPITEVDGDLLLFGILQSRFGATKRQHRIWIGPSGRPKRIDFRLGGSNPLVVEFALRPRIGGSQLHGSQNRAELSKLARIPPARARTRVLLLVDLHRQGPLDRDALKATYDPLNAGRGRFTRHSVRVVYGHPDVTYSFLWSPYTR